MGQPRLPVRRQQTSPLRDRVDVVSQRQRHHVRREPVDHRPSLLPGTGVGHLHGDRRAGHTLPVLGKRQVELAIEFPRRIVGDVEKGYLL